MTAECPTTCALYDLCTKIGGGHGNATLLGCQTVGDYNDGQREAARMLAELADKCDPTKGCAIQAGAVVMSAINWAG